MTSMPLITLRNNWPSLEADERVRAFRELSREDAEDFFLSLKTREQLEIILTAPERERRLWIRQLPPDDLVDVIQDSELPYEDFLKYLDPKPRQEVTALLAYAEDEAGGLMNPRFARVRPDMPVDEALRYVRIQSAQLETIRYVYVLDSEQRLQGVVSLRRLFSAAGGTLVRDVMRSSLITATESTAQEEIKALFSNSGLMAVPVLDAGGKMQGIVTVDDIVAVVEEDATEDIQQLGGTVALDQPYLQSTIWQLVKKRAGWLVVLFVGELFTATAMGYYEKEIERAVVLALFIPLIISSGGNSGSQASTLVVRALALSEVNLRDWWRILSREIVIGMILGTILGSLGLLRIICWPQRSVLYTEHFMAVGIAVGVSLAGVVLWGSLSGTMLPFLLKKAGLDPAVASAPFVATIVDVSGLFIYFTVASILLQGILL